MKVKYLTDEDEWETIDSQRIGIYSDEDQALVGILQTGPEAHWAAIRGDEDFKDVMRRLDDLTREFNTIRINTNVKE